MKIAYFDCFAGASGDMILGALLDAGVSREDLQAALDTLNLPGWDLQVQKVHKGGLAATQVTVQVDDKVPHRRLGDIEELLEASELPDQVKGASRRIFRRLADAEARVHDTAPEEVRLHDLGGLDTVVDVVGAVVGLRSLAVEAVYVSRLPMGRGAVPSGHGTLPLPAPATLTLIQGVPVYPVDVEGELVTPTGAAVLTGLAVGFDTYPPMTLEDFGYGAGRADFAFPNLLRLLVGSPVGSLEATPETLVLLETNIDDTNPEFYEHVMEALFAAGALDVYLTPLQMKKNRPGTLLTVLCSPEVAGALTRVLFAETTTLGVRQQEIRRWRLTRETISVETRFGPVRVKVAKLPDGTAKVAPEYEDCRRLAWERGVPLREVYAQAQGAARQERGANERQFDPRQQGGPGR